MSEKEKWNLPDKLRVDLNPELLEAANEQQKELAERFGPFQAITPKAKARQRAATIVSEAFANGVHLLTPEQIEELAEAAALLGRFTLAANMSRIPHRRSEFRRIQYAIDIEDGIDCGHGSKNKFAEAEVYSLKHNADVVLVRCTRCQDVNAIPAPEWLEQQRSRRQQIRTKYTGLKPLEAKAAMEADGVKPTA